MKLSDNVVLSEQVELLLIQRELLVSMRNHLSRRFLRSPQGVSMAPSIHERLQTLDREIAAYIAQSEAEITLLQASGARKATPTGQAGADDFVDSSWIQTLALIQSVSCFM